MATGLAYFSVNWDVRISFWALERSTSSTPNGFSDSPEKISSPRDHQVAPNTSQVKLHPFNSNLSGGFCGKFDFWCPAKESPLEPKGRFSASNRSCDHMRPNTSVKMRRKSRFSLWMYWRPPKLPDFLQRIRGFLQRWRCAGGRSHRGGICVSVDWIFTAQVMNLDYWSLVL